MSHLKRQSGFTIVELLIVIVVIAILAAISIVAYRGIQDRARTSTIVAALNQAAKKVDIWRVENSDQYPALLSDTGINDSDDISYQYSSSNTGTPTYCITAANQDSIIYSISSNSKQPQQGTCSGQNLLVWKKAQGTASMPVQTATMDTLYYRTSTASMRIGPNSNGQALRGTPYSGSAGQTYTVNLWIRTDSNWNGTVNNSKIRFGAVTDGSPLQTCSYNGVKTSWQQISCSYVLTSTYSTVNISVGNDGTVGNIWIDDLTLTRS